MEPAACSPSLGRKLLRASVCVRVAFFSQVGHSGWNLWNAENVNVHTYVYIMLHITNVSSIHMVYMR